MKKMLAMLLAAMMLLSLAACGGGNDDKTPSGNEGSTPPSSQQTGQNTPDEPDNSGSEENNGDWTQYFSIPGMTTPDGFTVKEASLYAGVGDSRFGTAVFEKSGGFTEADIEAFAQMVWDCCMEYSADGIYQTKYNSEGKVEIGDAFAALSDAKITDGYMWDYTNGEHIAMLSISLIGDTLKFETAKYY